jgi:hypothetical protein
MPATVTSARASLYLYGCRDIKFTGGLGSMNEKVDSLGAIWGFGGEDSTRQKAG